MNEINCPVCEAVAKMQYVTKAFGHGNNLLVIEDIPMIVCRVCHEQYITAKTLDEIEQLQQRSNHYSKLIHVERCAA